MTIGILGMGAGQSLLSAILHSKLARLGRICDRREQTAAGLLQRFNLPPEAFTTDYQVMLDDPEIDIIGIYTPDALHAEHILQALRVGKHVICTKPLLDMSGLDHAHEILQEAETSGRQVMVGQSTRHWESMIHQRRDFEEGALGELLTVEAHYHSDHRRYFEFSTQNPKEFGWLYGGISHPADLVRWYLPEIEEVMGYGSLSPSGKAAGMTEPDTMHFVLKSTDGRIARVSGCYGGPTQPTDRDSIMTCILRGTNGASQADLNELRYAIHTDTDGERTHHFTKKIGYYKRFGGLAHHAGEYQNYLEYFIRRLNAGETAYPDVREGIVTVALMKAMDLSIQTGQPQRIAEVLDRHDLHDLLR